MRALHRRHWMSALAGASALHVCAAAAVLWQAPESGAESAGLGGVEISLGAAGGAPGAAPAPLPEDAEAAPTVQAEDAIQPPDPARAPDPVPLAAPQLPAPQPEVFESALAERQETADIFVPTRREPQPPRAKPRPQLAQEPDLEAAGPPQLLADAVFQMGRLTPPAARAPSQAGAAGPAGRFQASEAGSGQALAAGGLPGEATDYIGLLRAWLEKHKRYPGQAQRRRLEGGALLHFVVDRDGRVLSYRLRRSSGYPILDGEVIAMIERAQPLPPLPEEIPQDRLELVVPVMFRLR